MASPLLEIHVHLSNGSVHRFAQNDPQHVEAFIEKLKARFFSQSHLTFFSANQVATYPGSAVSGLSLLMDPLPEALRKMAAVPALGIRDVVEISASEYQTLCGQNEAIAEGQEFLSVQAIEMGNGHRFYIAVDIERAVPSVQERQMIKHAFEGPELVCRRRGGLNIWNRAHMVSQHFSPSPDVPLPAFPAEFLGLAASE